MLHGRPDGRMQAGRQRGVPWSLRGRRPRRRGKVLLRGIESDPRAHRHRDAERAAHASQDGIATAERDADGRRPDAVTYRFAEAQRGTDRQADTVANRFAEAEHGADVQPDPVGNGLAESNRGEHVDTGRLGDAQEHSGADGAPDT